MINAYNNQTINYLVLVKVVELAKGWHTSLNLSTHLNLY